MLKQKQNKIFFFFFLNIYFYVGPYIDVFFFIPHFYLFIYYYFFTQVDKLGGTEPLSSETEGCLWWYIYIYIYIYINDFPLSSKRFHFIMYADDTTLSITIDSFNEDTTKNITSEINNELSKINEGLKINKLSLNKSKTKYMMSKKQRANIVKPILQIDGINIDSVDHFNCLGLTLDSRMTWNNHTTNISNKCSRTIAVLNRIKHVIPLIVRILLYNTLILPHFNYCITAWGYQCDRIIKLQKKAIRIISISTYNAHTEPLLKNLRILKIQDILILQTLKMYHKHWNNKLPT